MEVILETLIDGPILNSVLFRKHITRIRNTASPMTELTSQSRKHRVGNTLTVFQVEGIVRPNKESLDRSSHKAASGQ